MPHPTKRQFLALLSSAVALAACGGSDEPALRSKDLYSAYEAVGEGMSLKQLELVIGAGANSSVPDESLGTRFTTYTWVADKGSYLETRLHVSVEPQFGVVGKTITGPNGAKTASYL
jgi:hypothetical protein